MAIKGLTDQKPRLPVIGKLRKGGEKPERGPGRDLDYFRFVGTDPDADAAFKAAYPGQPREVDGVFPYPTLDENFEAWNERHVKASNDKFARPVLHHRCNGEFCVRWLDEKTGQYVNDPDMLQKRPCPGECKQVGRLHLILPKLGRLAVVTAITSSVYDIASLYASMCDLDNRKIGSSMMNIPVVLRRVLREVPVTIEGKKTLSKKWLLQVEAHPTFVRAALAAGEAMALTGAAPRLNLGEVAPQLQLTTSLPDDGPIDDDEVLEGEPVDGPVMSAEQMQMIDDIKALFLEGGKTEGEWSVYFEERKLATRSLDDLRGVRELLKKALKARTEKAAV